MTLRVAILSALVTAATMYVALGGGGGGDGSQPLMHNGDPPTGGGCGSDAAPAQAADAATGAPPRVLPGDDERAALAPTTGREAVQSGDANPHVAVGTQHRQRLVVLYQVCPHEGHRVDEEASKEVHVRRVQQIVGAEQVLHALEWDCEVAEHVPVPIHVAVHNVPNLGQPLERVANKHVAGCIEEVLLQHAGIRRRPTPPHPSLQEVARQLGQLGPLQQVANVCKRLDANHGLPDDWKQRIQQRIAWLKPRLMVPLCQESCKPVDVLATQRCVRAPSCVVDADVCPHLPHVVLEVRGPRREYGGHCIYESTIDILYRLYDLVDVGGYVIIDDWSWEAHRFGARAAAMDFRRIHSIEDDAHGMVDVDGIAAFWRKARQVTVQHHRYPKDVFPSPPITAAEFNQTRDRWDTLRPTLWSDADLW